ncbi:hypothetical protein [Nesterenkonia alba]|uniref:hypothetical protein n=1 Tax=Nesterenkonia alba TaxID=515814 RepID=UPI0003B59FD0|nr:hypothetical protein [Nesterenkonia alba]
MLKDTREVIVWTYIMFFTVSFVLAVLMHFVFIDPVIDWGDLNQDRRAEVAEQGW